MKHGHLKQTVLNLVHGTQNEQMFTLSNRHPGGSTRTVGNHLPSRENLFGSVMSPETYRRRSSKSYVEGGRHRRNQRKNCGEREGVNMSANEKPPYEGTRPVLSSPSRRQVPRADRLVPGPAGAS